MRRVFFSFFFWERDTAEDKSTVKIRAHRSTRSHRPKQVGQVRCRSIDPRHRVVRTCNQGRSERPGARDQQHSGPPLPPRQECGSAQPERCVSRLGLGQFLNETEGLCAPPSARLECDNHDTTPLCCDKFGISGFLVTSSLGQDGSIHSGSICERNTAASQHTSQGDVKGQLCPMADGEPNSQHLNFALVTGINVDAHVPQLDVASDRCPASRQTWAKVISVATARRFNLPDRGHAAQCLPNRSFWPPHSHVASVRRRGSRKRSRTKVRKKRGCTWNSSPVGAPWSTAPAPGPEWDRKWA